MIRYKVFIIKLSLYPPFRNILFLTGYIMLLDQGPMIVCYCITLWPTLSSKIRNKIFLCLSYYYILIVCARIEVSLRYVCKDLKMTRKICWKAPDDIDDVQLSDTNTVQIIMRVLIHLSASSSFYIQLVLVFEMR